MGLPSGESTFLATRHKHLAVTRVSGRDTGLQVHVLVQGMFLFIGQILVRTEALPNLSYSVGQVKDGGFL